MTHYLIQMQTDAGLAFYGWDHYSVEKGKKHFGSASFGSVQHAGLFSDKETAERVIQTYAIPDVAIVPLSDVPLACVDNRYPELTHEYLALMMPQMDDTMRSEIQRIVPPDQPGLFLTLYQKIDKREIRGLPVFTAATGHVDSRGASLGYPIIESEKKTIAAYAAVLDAWHRLYNRSDQ